MVINELTQAVKEEAKRTRFSGVVAVFKGKETLAQESFGYADIVNNRMNDLGTRFAIASGTKFFTALGIGTLIDAGKLSLDTTVHDIFQNDLTYVDSRATIAQFLTHSSGIYDYYDEDLDIDSENFSVDIPWSCLETPSDYLPLFESKKPKYPPGNRFSYSNGGFIFLGVIIEKITGQLYRGYIQNHVFKPADMNNSGYFAFNKLPNNAAYGYKANGETNIYNLPMRGGSDGGAYTTVSDLKNMWQALFSNQILSKKLTTDFLTPHIVIESPVKYGYGVYISEFKDMNMFYFVGGDAGVGFDCRYLPEKELQTTIISNKTDGEEKVRDVVYSFLAGIV